MTDNNQPLGELCRRLIPDLRHVSLNDAAISQAARTLAGEPLPLPAWDHPAFPSKAGKVLDAVVWLGNALNFCYWVPEGESMWSFTVAGQPEVDAFALFGRLTAAFDEGHDLNDSRVLKSDVVPQLFASGQGLMPLLEDRIRIFREIGNVLEQQFDGRLENAVEAAGNDALSHAQFLAETFPSFNDTRSLDSIVVPVLKRAQLAAGMLHAARLARDTEGFNNTERLTVYADYMLPVALRSLGVMTFTPELEETVNNKHLLEAGSREESEIRIATIAACDRLIEETRAQGGSIDALRLDFWLWRRGFECEDHIPHHRVITTDY